MKLNRTLSGFDIHLKSLSPDSVTDSCFKWFYDEDVMRFLEVRFSRPKSLFDLANFISTVNESHDSVMAGIFLNSNQSHIGNIKLGSINTNHATAEIGYLIGERSSWGRGYASQAIKLMVEYAFSDLGVIKITAGCSQGNEGSRQALLKAGFSQEGLLSSQLMVDGHRRSVYQMGIINPSIQGSGK